MWHVLTEIANWIGTTAAMAAEYPHDTVPTAEEPGFKFTVNLGQVIQIAGIGVPFLVYINRMSIRHALMDANMKNLNSAVAALQADMKTVSLAMASIPTMVKTSQSNHAMISALVGHRIRKQVDNAQGEGDITEEFLDGLGEKLRDIGKD